MFWRRWFFTNCSYRGTSFEFTYDYEPYAEDGNVLLDSFTDFESGGMDIDPTPNQNFGPEDTLLIEDFLGQTCIILISIDIKTILEHQRLEYQ